MASKERFWSRRLRWRLRGAPLWPAFVALTLVDAVVLTLLPPLQSTGLNLIEGVLIATFGNLVLVGAAAPFLARRLGARRAAPPRAAGESTLPVVVLQERIAVGLLVVGLVAVVVSGLANRPVVVSETEATEAAGDAVRDYVEASGDDELQRNLETANIDRLGEDYFRVCLARDDRARFFCVFVDTAVDPPRVRRDPSAEPNTFEDDR
jgi:hypothetical protein